MSTMSHTEAYTDVVELCALLQCLGFNVKSLDASDGNISQDGGTRTVVINCQMSGIHVVLESANKSCSCPTQSEQNSGMWQVSGVAGGKQLDKEFGCTLLGSLPLSHRERLTKDLQEMIRCIKENNESTADVGKTPKEDKSASMTDLKTPEKLLLAIKAETPTRYRSLDTLTGGKDSEQQLPRPGLLQRARLISECENETDTKKMCSRQSTYTLSSTPGSVRRRNKTSSPIQAPSNNLLEALRTAEKTAIELRNQLAYVIREYAMEDEKNDSSMSSLALDVSKISVLKVPDTSKAMQFASSPNLSGISAHDEITKSRLKRYESASTSKISRLISPSDFKKKDTASVKVDKIKSQDGRSRLKSLFKPKIVTPVRNPMPESSPNLSSSRKKYSHIKSTIPRPAKKD